MTIFSSGASLRDVFDLTFIIFAFAITAVNTFFAAFMGRKFLQIFQSSGYMSLEYNKWTYRRDNVYLTRLCMVTMLSVLAYMIFSAAFSFIVRDWVVCLGFVFYLIFSIIYITADLKRKSKARLVFTSRLIRLMVTFLILYFLLTLLLIASLQLLGFIFAENELFVIVRFAFVCILPITIPVLVSLAGFINSPFERWRNKKYITRCKKTLEEADGLIKIAITGSYGKTSVKKILKTILGTKYKVLATPASYNTPMGICKCVNGYDGTHDVFIAEMGARRVGNIKELCDIVKPDYAIISSVNNQHLETFGTKDAIAKTKYELIEGLRDGGVAVFSADNLTTAQMSLRARERKGIKTVLAGNDLTINPDVYATDLKITPTGSDFTLNFGDKSVKASTQLIGRHNVSNICLAAAIAYELGLSPEEISMGISLIKPISHRLEVIKNDKNVTIIDDSYNSNVDGTVAALEVFSIFEGRKIIITPGLVELGHMEHVENFRFGRRMAPIVDYAILVGNQNCYRIRDGLLEEGFDLNKIIIAKDLADGIKKLNEISKEGDVILFENDLPDKFL